MAIKINSPPQQIFDIEVLYSSAVLAVHRNVTRLARAVVR